MSAAARRSVTIGGGGVSKMSASAAAYSSSSALIHRRISLRVTYLELDPSPLFSLLLMLSFILKVITCIEKIEKDHEEAG